MYSCEKFNIIWGYNTLKSLERMLDGYFQKWNFWEVLTSRCNYYEDIDLTVILHEYI